MKESPRVLKLLDDPEGQLKLWVSPDVTSNDGEVGRFEVGDCAVIGFDVAEGSQDSDGRGYSNSSGSILGVFGDKVRRLGKYTTHGIRPGRFAKVGCALGWLFCDKMGRPAYLNWENNGPGEFFGNQLVEEYEYPRYYADAGRSGLSMDQHRNKIDGKMIGRRVNAFNLLRDWLAEGRYVELSYEVLDEMAAYRLTNDGSAEHSGRSSKDPTKARANHGDDVTSTIVALWTARDYMLGGCNMTNSVVDSPPKYSPEWHWQQQHKGRFSSSGRQLAATRSNVSPFRRRAS